MAKLWTVLETKHLQRIMEQYGRGAEYNKQKIAYEFAKAYPNRTFEAIRAKMKEIRALSTPPFIKDGFKDTLDELSKSWGKERMPPPQYNPIDVAFTRPVSKTDIIRHYRDMGLRGKIMLDLGE